MTATLPDVSTPTPPETPRRRPLVSILLAVALAVGGVTAVVTWAVSYFGTGCEPFPGADGTVDLAQGGELVGEATVDGQDFEVSFAAASDRGEITRVMQIGTGVAVFPVSVVAEAADGAGHSLVIRVEQHGPDLLVSAHRDGALTASLTYPDATIGNSARLTLSGGYTGTVSVRDVVVSTDGTRCELT
jgi:hypothetical protein